MIIVFFLQTLHVFHRAYMAFHLKDVDASRPSLANMHRIHPSARPHTATAERELTGQHTLGSGCNPPGTHGGRPYHHQGIVPPEGYRRPCAETLPTSAESHSQSHSRASVAVRLLHPRSPNYSVEYGAAPRWPETRARHR